MQGDVARPQARERSHPAVLIGVSLWRMAVIASALIGFLAALETMNDPWQGLSQLASLYTAIVFGVLLLWPLLTLGRQYEPRSPWIRGGTTILLLLVSGVYMAMMGGDVSETWSLFEHVITPLMVFLDWIFAGRSTARVKWWHPLTWPVVPLAYWIYYVAEDIGLYGGMFSPEDEDFGLTFPGFLAGVIVTGYLLYGIGKIRKAASSDQQGPPPQQPGWQPGYPQPMHPQPMHPQGYGPVQQQMPQAQPQFQQHPSEPFVQPGQPQPPVPYGPGPQPGPPR